MHAPGSHSLTLLPLHRIAHPLTLLPRSGTAMPDAIGTGKRRAGELWAAKGRRKFGNSVHSSVWTSLAATVNLSALIHESELGPGKTLGNSDEELGDIGRRVEGSMIPTCAEVRGFGIGTGSGQPGLGISAIGAKYGSHLEFNKSNFINLK